VSAKSAIAIWKSKPSWLPNPAQKENGKNPNMNDLPTERECDLTVAGTICVLALKQLLADYEHLAAKHDIIPSPVLPHVINSTIEGMVKIFHTNTILNEIFIGMITEAVRDQQTNNDTPSIHAN
jgi:hypothetical protein